MRAGLCVGLSPFAVACTPADPPPSTTVPVATSSASASATNASDEYTAAEALVSSGKFAEAREAFTAVARKFAYSRFAKESQLRVAQLDDKLGKPEAVTELQAWAKEHPTDARAAAILARARTVGDTTCHADADCAVTTKRDCCDCCPSGPYATSKTWLSWQTGQCTTVKCAACLNPQCAAVDALTHSRCSGGTCELAP